MDRMIDKRLAPHGAARPFSKGALFEMVDYHICSSDVVPFHKSESRIKIVSSAARTSKSFSAEMDVLVDHFPYFALDEDGGWMLRENAKGQPEPIPVQSVLGWFIGPDYKTNKEFEYAYNHFVRNRSSWIGDEVYTVPKGHANNPKQGNMQYTLFWGRNLLDEEVSTTVYGMSATRPQDLQGEEVDFAVMSEAAEQQERIFTKYLATRCHKILLPTTPKVYASWIRDLIHYGQEDSRTGIEHFQFEVKWDEDPGKRKCPNPTFDWTRFEQEMARASVRSKTGIPEDDPDFAEQFLGHWVMHEGKILPFRKTDFGGHMSHLTTTIPENFAELAKVVALDYGYDHPAAALFFLTMNDGTKLCFDEIVEQKLDPEAFVKAIVERLEHWDFVPDYILGDPSRPEIDALLRRKDLPVYTYTTAVTKNTLRDRPAGYANVVDHLSDCDQFDPPRPKLFFHEENCPKVIEELDVLRRKKEFAGDEFSKSAIDQDCTDDCFDALRYYLQSRPQPRLPMPEMTWFDQYEMNQRHREHSQRNMFATPNWGPSPAISRGY